MPRRLRGGNGSVADRPWVAVAHRLRTRIVPATRARGDPVTSGPRQKTTDRLDDIAELMCAGESAERIAERLDVTVTALDATLRRAHRPDIARALGTAGAAKRTRPPRPYEAVVAPLREPLPAAVTDAITTDLDTAYRAAFPTRPIS